MVNYSGHDDKALTALLREGNRAAFLEIYQRYQGLLLTYAFRKLQDRTQAEDVVQEVFISLWEKRENFELKTYLSGYLYKSVLNKVLNIFQHNKVVRAYLSSQNLQIDVDHYGTDFLIREKEIALMIEKEISAMPPKMQEVYRRKHQQFQSTKEIAQEMGIAENTVSNQLKSASAHLKKNLGIIIYVLYLLDR